MRIITTLPTVLMNVAAASGLMSFITFAYSFYKDTQIQESEFNQLWQEGEIYGIVFEGSPVGIKFPEILAKLNERIDTVRAPLGLNVENATIESLRRALIGLTEKGIVILRADHTYVVPMQPVDQMGGGPPVDQMGGVPPVDQMGAVPPPPLAQSRQNPV